jgi:hypothetical protein
VIAPFQGLTYCRDLIDKALRAIGLILSTAALG